MLVKKHANLPSDCVSRVTSVSRPHNRETRRRADCTASGCCITGGRPALVEDGELLGRLEDCPAGLVDEDLLGDDRGDGPGIEQVSHGGSTSASLMRADTLVKPSSSRWRDTLWEDTPMPGQSFTESIIPTKRGYRPALYIQHGFKKYII